MFHFYYQLSGEVPAKKNANKFNRRTKVMYKNAHFQEWHAEALRQLAEQKKPDQPINSPIKIYLFFQHGDKRERDSDNGATTIFDLLQDAKIIENDKWQIINSYVVHNEYRKNLPRCCIIIDEIEEEDAERRYYVDE